MKYYGNESEPFGPSYYRMSRYQTKLFTFYIDQIIFVQTVEFKCE